MPFVRSAIGFIHRIVSLLFVGLISLLASAVLVFVIDPRTGLSPEQLAVDEFCRGCALWATCFPDRSEHTAWSLCGRSCLGYTSFTQCAKRPDSAAEVDQLFRLAVRQHYDGHYWHRTLATYIARIGPISLCATSYYAHRAVTRYVVAQSLASPVPYRFEFGLVVAYVLALLRTPQAPIKAAAPTLSGLPLETLRYIFSLACTDGGYTARSLSLVSRTHRSAVRFVRHRSIALNVRPETLASLVAALERDCVGLSGYHHSSGVHHLFLARAYDTSTHPAEDPTLIHRLMSIVAPNLRTLVVNRLPSGLFSPSATYPALTELTLIWHPVGRSSSDDLGIASCLSLPVFPVLSKLHIAHASSVLGTLAVCSRHAPRLTELRLSALPLTHETRGAIDEIKLGTSLCLIASESPSLSLA